MRLALIVLSFSLTSAGLSAQAVVGSGASSGSFRITGKGLQKADSSASAATPWSNMSGCPVALRATQISSANMMQTRKDQSHPQQWGQRLHLTFTSREEKQIAGATVAVWGFALKPRMMNAGNTTDLTARKVRPGEQPQKDSTQAARTIHVAFQAGTSVATDVWVPGISATQTIDLLALTYADGTSWKLAEGQTCQIKPDPLMLISASSR